MTRLFRTEIEYCYKDGRLPDALRQAADFIERNKITDANIHHIVSQFTDEAGWTVEVVYEKHEQ